MRLKIVIAAALGVVGVGLGIWGWNYSRTVWIPAGHVGVLYDASGGLEKQVITPRAVLVGWRQQLYIYPTRLKIAVYTQDASEGESKTADGILITTSDNASTVFDIAVVYHVNKEDVLTVFNAFGPIPIEDIQVQHIRRAVKETVNDIGTKYDYFEFMGAKRAEAGELIQQGLQSRLHPKGLTIDKVLIGHAYPTQDQLAKTNAKVNSITGVQIAGFNQELQAKQQQAQNKTALAQADARAIKGAQANPLSLDMIDLELDEMAVDRWNGHLPTVRDRPGQTLILGKDVLPVTKGKN